MSIYSNDNISKIAKLTTRELPHLAKTAKITVRENNGVYSTLWTLTEDKKLLKAKVQVLSEFWTKFLDLIGKVTYINMHLIQTR